jgi:hypothetical protein
VDNKPIMLLYGNVPAYRDLKIGVEGKDMENPERNLSKLGYDGFTVDEEFTYDTCCRRPADLGGGRRTPPEVSRAADTQAKMPIAAAGGAGL